MGGYFPFCDCSSLRPICPTQDEPSCIELKDPDDLYLVNCNVLTYCWKINKSWTKNSCHFILNGLSINTYYSIIIVISCTLMINKVTQTRCSSMYFFLLTQYRALKVLFQQRRTRTSIFFFHCLDSEKRTFRACVISRWSTTIFFNVFNQDAGVCWKLRSPHKYLNRPLIGNDTRRYDEEFILSRFTWLFYMFLLFLWVSPRNAWGQDHWIDRDKWCVL